MTMHSDAIRGEQGEQRDAEVNEDVSGFMIPNFMLDAAERALKAKVPAPHEYGGRIPTRQTVRLGF
jgi:hypothetical protein